MRSDDGCKAKADCNENLTDLIPTDGRVVRILQQFGRFRVRGASHVEEFMLRIAIIIGSTRPGRKGEAVAKWAYEIAQTRHDASLNSSTSRTSIFHSLMSLCLR